MKTKPTDRLRSIVLAGVAAASVASAAPQAAQAQTQVPGSEEVAVAIIDSNIRRIDFDDPNVRIVDMTPKQAPEGTSFMKYKVNDFYSHGDIVASSFVREFRKIDANAPIVIYVVDPFVRKDGNASANFSMRIMNDALPRMRDAGVRVAITAFGISDRAAGQRIADSFTRNGMALFAAVPNEPGDRGIYPAAIPGVISVASEKKDGAFEHDRSMATWVSLTISGSHGSAHNTSDADGTSFAVAHAGAYGAFIMKRRPDLEAGSLGSEIAGHGRPMEGNYGDRPRVTVRIGGSDMIRNVVAAYTTVVPTRPRVPAAVAASDGPSQTVMAAMSVTRSISR